jgi:hypothetical protein
LQKRIGRIIIIEDFAANNAVANNLKMNDHVANNLKMKDLVANNLAANDFTDAACAHRSAISHSSVHPGRMS